LEKAKPKETKSLI